MCYSRMEADTYRAWGCINTDFKGEGSTSTQYSAIVTNADFAKCLPRCPVFDPPLLATATSMAPAVQLVWKDSVRNTVTSTDRVSDSETGAGSSALKTTSASTESIAVVTSPTTQFGVKSVTRPDHLRIKTKLRLVTNGTNHSSERAHPNISSISSCRWVPVPPKKKKAASRAATASIRGSNDVLRQERSSPWHSSSSKPQLSKALRPPTTAGQSQRRNSTPFIPHEQGP